MAESRKFTKAEREEYVADLRVLLHPGDTLHTVLRHVSKSGMRRLISVKRIHEGHLEDLSYKVAAATDYRLDRQQHALIVDGAGMDMGFEVCYQLGRALYPEGFGEQCINTPEEGRCTYRPQTREEARKAYPVHSFRGRNGDTSGWESEGGYAFEREWI